MGNESKDKPRILIVDDVETNRFTLRDIIADMGCQPILTENGEQALKIVERFPLSLIISDVAMPVMDGYEATKLIRDLDNRIIANVPIVAMTANAFGEERRKAFACGMNGYITKPIETNVLFETLKQIIE